MAAAPRVKNRTPAQIAAGRKFAAAGRAAQAAHRGRRSAKQRAAALKWASAGRAAQKARRAGKKPVAAKKPAAPLDLQLAPDQAVPAATGPDLLQHHLPLCALTALAEHLHAFTGITAPGDELAALHARYGLITLDDLFEAVAADGLAGARPASWTRCDPDTLVPGLLYGVQLRAGYHAALAHPAGMISWGMLLPWPRMPAEAWHLEWAVP